MNYSVLVLCFKPVLFQLSVEPPVLLPWYAFSLFFFSVSMKCSEAALIFWTHNVLKYKKKKQIELFSLTHNLIVYAAAAACAPLVEGLCLQRVDAVDVRDVEERLVAGRVGGHFHQHLVEEQRLRTEGRKWVPASSSHVRGIRRLVKLATRSPFCTS